MLRDYKKFSTWKPLHSGKLAREDIMREIKDPFWQAIRLQIKGLPLEDRYQVMAEFLDDRNHDFGTQVVVTNYVNALLRGGMIEYD